MLFPNPMPDSCWFHSEAISSDCTGLHPSELILAEIFKYRERQDEYLSGRRCVHQIISSAKLPTLPVLRMENRSPAWPLGLVGSITHGASVAAALIAQPHHQIIGIGIDLEDLTREIRSNITRHVLTPWEIQKWAPQNKQVNRETRMIFSIKEAIYKCFQPIHGIRLGFKDAEVLEMEEGEFTATLLKNPFNYSLPLPLTIKGVVRTHQNAVFAAVKANAKDYPPS